MESNGGLLIAAILVLAIAAGCKRDDRSGEASRRGAPRAPSDTEREHVVTVEAPDDTVSVTVTAKSPTTARATTRPAPTPRLGQARSDLGDLADNALKLRHALLHADFRGVDEDPANGEGDTQTKEARNVPR